MAYGVREHGAKPPAPDYVRTTLAVWEMTLRCSLRCMHCGSRAGEPREHELTTAEALDLVGQLAEVGIREIALIGGEAFLRRDWLEIAEAIHHAGMTCSVTTSGFGLSAEIARRMKHAGIRHASVSVDGLQPAHDYLRGRAGSFSAACAAVGYLADARLMVGANTQINRLTAPDLPELYEVLRSRGVKAWQLQLTVPSGNAADHPEILLQPAELVDVFDMLARLAIRALQDGVAIAPGNNLGYHGPFDDLLIAAGGSYAVGEGCQAGISVLGIEADGTVKGCPSLPRAPYAGRSIRSRRLQEMLDEPGWGVLHPGHGEATRAKLWGFCRDCEFAASCQGGCTWTAQALLGRPGNNPYCHHRALTLARAGMRERITQVATAPGVPFDHGVFELIEERSDAPWPEGDHRFTRDAIRWPSRDRRE